MFKSIIIFQFFIIFYSINASKCGYESCPKYKENAINIHLVPHSHDDVGWLKTVDQYYYGSRNSIQKAGVQYILDAVVDQLLKDSKRRFIYVETAFLMLWSMNDEAAVHYQSVIDQFTLGLKSLKDEFGNCSRPRVAWQIDPFGHSREMAALLAQMGYDGEFFARIDYLDKSNRMQHKTPEMIWKADKNLGVAANLFTGVLYNHYSAPPGFCFDILCNDEPFIDGHTYENNVKRKVNEFLTYIQKISNFYLTKHLMVPMGDDFNYASAHINFKNMDKLIKYVNERQKKGSKVNVFYSTPSCYLAALHKENISWPIKTEDFFPYSTDYHSYWTGYYSSRPTQKRFERLGNQVLQIVAQLTVLARLVTDQATQNLYQLKSAMGVWQHHDAITGTERQLVAYDYDRILYEGIAASQYNIQESLRKLTGLKDGSFMSCLQLNISVCELMQQDTKEVVLTIFNALFFNSTQYVRIPIPDANYEITDLNGNRIMSQVVKIPESLLNLAYRFPATKYELVFLASVHKFSNFYIKQISSEKIVMPEVEVEITSYISLADDEKQLILLNDRAQGGSSLRDGDLELMLHRRLLHDDAFGVGESLNETAYGKGLIARGKIQLHLKSTKVQFEDRFAQLEQHLPFWLFFSSSNDRYHIKNNLHVHTDLPYGINILSLEHYAKNEILIRFENFLRNGKSINVNLRPIFDYLNGLNIRETTLDANLNLKEMKRMNFQGIDEPNKENDYLEIHHQDKNEFNITLNSMEIRTFIIEVYESLKPSFL